MTASQSESQMEEIGRRRERPQRRGLKSMARPRRMQGAKPKVSKISLPILAQAWGSEMGMTARLAGWMRGAGRTGFF